MTLQEIQVELARLTYRPGWSITVGQHPWEGFTYRIVARRVPDAYGGPPIDLGIDGFLPPIPDAGYLHAWLAWRLGRIEIHECLEFLHREGAPIFDPHEEATT